MDYQVGETVGVGPGVDGWVQNQFTLVGEYHVRLDVDGPGGKRLGDEVAVDVVQSYDTGLVHTVTGSSSLIVGQVDFFQFYLVLILGTTEVTLDWVDTTTILVAGYVTVSVGGEVVNNNTVLESVQTGYASRTSKLMALCSRRDRVITSSTREIRLSRVAMSAIV